MNSKKLFIILFLFATAILSFAQESNVNIENNIYDFLSKLAQKGIIKYDDLVKPISRKYVAEKLVEARANFSELTNLQKDELEFYESEYGYEVKKKNSEFRIQNSEKELGEEVIKKIEDENNEINDSEQITNDNEQTSNDLEEKRDLFDKSWQFEVRTNDEITTKDKLTLFAKDEYERFRVLGYENNLMRLNVSPVLGYENGKWETKAYDNIFAGVKFNGEFGDILGFNFELKHTRQTPGYIDNLYNRFSNKRAIDLLFSDSERLEYPTVNADLGVSWSWGSFVFGKNYLNWGYGENGKVVLSDRAPSFPYLKLSVKPAEWFSFNYIHAWLNSDVIDSSSYYSTWRYAEYGNTDRYSYKSKFIALHSATFIPYENLELSIGESVVYADELQIVYLIPFMFFDLGDEYLMRNDNYAGSSTQLFLSLSSRNHIKNAHLYVNFHADELTPDGLFDPQTQYYKMAFTFGGNIVDLPINNLDITLEYTKVYPGNYRHFIPTLTYESSSTLMGHWIGDNADMIYGAIDYTIFRGLNFKVWTQYIRKGTEALGNRAYQVTIPQPHFLFTDNIRDRKNYTYYGIDTEYEFSHEVWLKAHFQYIDFEQRIGIGKYKSNLFRDFSLTLGYGI
ncbi:MAG: hypothetical protein IPM32_16820 [Ignavibacteriae bacterium]|nr:hypothetical protein [Ignavibacteriota bacterium]